MNSDEYLLSLFKRKNKSRRIILSVTSILCTLLIIPTLHLTFKAALQKSNIDDYYLTVKNKSFTIIKSKTDSEVK